MDEDLIKEELSFRIEEDHDLRFSPRIKIENSNGLTIVSRNDWKGVMDKESVVVPTIYDNVRIIHLPSFYLIITEIMGKMGLWKWGNDGSSRLLEESYVDIRISQFFSGVMFVSENGEGLFDLRRNKIIFNPEFIKVSINTESKYIWGWKDDFHLIFFNPESLGEKEIKTSDPIIPFEHCEFAGYITTDGQIVLLEGDTFSFRKLVSSKGGRIAISNSRIGKAFLTDANGFVLNM